MKHVIRKKVFHHPEENLIRADRKLVMLLRVAHQVAVRFRAEVQKANRKELLVMSRQAKRKATLQEEKRLIQAGQHPKAGQKEVLEASLLKGNLSVNQVSKAAKGLQIGNLAAVHQKIQDTSHFVNRLIHLIISLHSKLNVPQKTNRYGQGRNLQRNPA